MWILRLLERTFLRKYIVRLRNDSLHLLPRGIKPKAIWNEYMTISSIHGIQHATNSKTLFERIWWTLSIIGSIIACILFIQNIYNKWNRSPVIVSFSSQPTPVIDIPLPAMTICPQVKSQNRLFNFSALLEDIRIGTDIDKKYSSDEYSYLLDILKMLCPRSETLQEVSTAVPFFNLDLFDSIKNLAPPKNQTIVACGIENSLTKNCTRLFQRVITENGLCYTFNGLTAHQMYRDDVLHSTSGLRMTGDEEIPELQWSLDGGYRKSVVDPDIYPFNSVGAMLGKPYSFVFALLKDDLTADCETFQGFKIFLHPQNEIPMHTSNYIKAPIKNDIRIYAMPRMLVTTDEIISYTPDQRGCYFSHEKPLRLFKEYNEINCYIECIANYTSEQCQCIPFQWPRLRQMKICGSTQTKCIKEAQNNFLRAYLNLENTVECNCKPSCTSIAYDVDTQSAPAENLLEMYTKLGIDNFEKYQTSTVSLIYKESLFTRIRRREFFSRTDVVANCGGILGLFLGISIISFVELFYYVFLRPYLMYREKRSEHHVTSRQPTIIANIPTMKNGSMLRVPSALTVPSK